MTKLTLLDLINHIFTGNNCNNPEHNHQTSTRPSPSTHPTYATRPTVITTKKTTVYTQASSTYRPPTTNKHPTTHQTTHSTLKPTTTKPIHTSSKPIHTSLKPTVTTHKPTQTYPPRPSSTPNPTGSGTSNLGVQPPSTRPTTTPNPNSFVPGNRPPFFIIPYPFPIVPSCPCYFIEPTGNYSSQHQQQLQWQQQLEQSNQLSNSQYQWQSQNQYVIGFIPVLFVPHCSSGNHSNQVSGQYLQLPYPCAQCNQSNRNGRELDLNENYSSSDSFKQVLAQAGVDIFSNSLVKSPNRKSRARKLKRVQRVEEPHLSEFHEIKHNSPKDDEK